MAMTQSRQKSYVNARRRDLTFKEDNLVYSKVSPMKGVKRFGKKGRLSPRYIGPYQVREKVGQVAYIIGLVAKYQEVHHT